MTGMSSYQNEASVIRFDVSSVSRLGLFVMKMPSVVLSLALLMSQHALAGPALKSKPSTKFAYKYEMDVSPGGQNLDKAGAMTDWYAGYVGIEMEHTIPKTFVHGVAYSRQSPPEGFSEALFRTDFEGSVQRRSLREDFSIEVSVLLLGAIDEGDVGGFNISVDPGGAASAFRLNVGHQSVSLNYNGGSVVETGDNTDRMHVFRIAYKASSDRYWVWRDGVMVYGDDLSSGIPGSSWPFNDKGSILIGDSTASISGEWALDYIRLDPAATAPKKVAVRRGRKGKD